MKTYTVLFAEDIPHYARTEIRTRSGAAAVEAARGLDRSELVYEPEWEDAVCQRIVEIIDESGNVFARDIQLDNCLLCYADQNDRLLHEDARALFSVLELTLEQLEMWIDFADGKDPAAEAVAQEARALIAKHRRTP